MLVKSPLIDNKVGNVTLPESEEIVNAVVDALLKNVLAPDPLNIMAGIEFATSTRFPDNV